MKDLIEALNIFLKYLDEDEKYPTHCEHDEMTIIGVCPEEVSVEDIKRLDELGFFVSEEYGEKMFKSFRFGSA